MHFTVTIVHYLYFKPVLEALTNGKRNLSYEKLSFIASANKYCRNLQ